MLFRVGRTFESRRSGVVVRVGPGEVNDIERRGEPQTHVIPVQFAMSSFEWSRVLSRLGKFPHQVCRFPGGGMGVRAENSLVILMAYGVAGGCGRPLWPCSGSLRKIHCVMGVTWQTN